MLNRHPITCLLLAGTALAALAQPAHAQSWDGSDNSNVNDPDNWSGNAVPATNATVSINDGTVTTQPVIAVGEELNVRSVNVGADGGTTPLLTVNGVLGLSDGPNGGTLNIASAANNLTGIVLVSGSAARIGPQAGSTAGIAARVGTTLGSNGTLRIENGGRGTFQSLQIANGVPAAAGVGLVEVRGAGSLLEITSGAAGLSVGNLNAGGGVGTLRILDGAAFTTPGGVGSVVGFGSSILVSGADGAGNGSRFIVPTQLQVRGGSFTVEGGAEAEIGGFILDNNATFNLLDGGTLSSLGVAIGSSPFVDSNVTAIVSGAGSRWTSTPTNGTLTIGNGTTGFGRLEVLNGGEVDFNSTLTLGLGSSLRVAGTDAAGVNARLTVESAQSLNGVILVEDGGIATFRTIGLNNPASLTVTAGGLVVVEQTSTFSIGQQAEVRISGAGAEIRSNGGLGLVNNSAGQPTADFIIENGARLELSGTVGAGVTFSSGGSERRNLIIRNGAQLDIINPGFGFLGSNGGVFVENGSQVITQGNWTLGGASELAITGGSRMELNGGTNSTFSPQTDILLSGAGSLLDIAANISLGGGNPGGGTVVITDGATLRTRGLSDNGLGFNGVLRTVEITNGGSWIMTGGANAGLQIETTDLLVNGGTLSAEGIVTIGQRFTGTTLTLLDSDFAARQLDVRAGSGTIVNLGGTRTSAAGSVGEFDVGTVFIGAGNALVINHNTANFNISSVIGSGTGNIEHLAGDTIFSGAAGGFGGMLEVTGGRVRVNGVVGGNTMQTNVSGGAALGGTGTIGGNVTITNGTLAAGNSPGTLTIGGALTLGGASTLQFELGAPGSTAGIDGDLINVGGNLTLDGTLDIIDLGGFGTGLYRLINYGGTLTNNGLAFGTVPAGFEATGLMLDVATTGQVNLLATGAEPDFDFIFWDGAATTANGLINGGSGTWNTTNTNWTTLEADNNGVFDPADFLIFRAPEQAQSAGLLTTAAATPSSSTGLVTVDNAGGQVRLANGVQFATTGYTIGGGSILLDAPLEPCGECSPTPGNVIVRVGDGSMAGAAFVATISAALTGESGLAKTDLGTLILTGANTYAGGTQVNGGTLQGDTTSLQRSFTIAEGANLLFNQSAAGTFAGTILGDGNVLKQGGGTLTLSGMSAAFKGDTRLETGAINLAGSLGGLLTTLAGTTLSGTGQVESLDLSGTIAPGNSIGTLDINGPAIFRAGSTYQVELAANGTGDFLLVDDTATILGGTVAISLLDPELNYVDGTRWTILEAEEGLTGTFAGLTENSAFLDFTLGYTADTAFLTLALVRMFPDVAMTFNQRQTSTGLMELDRTTGSDSLAVYNALLMLDGDAARAAFDITSGEIYANVLAGGQRSAQARGAELLRRGQEVGKPGWDAWMAAGLGRSRVKDDGNGARFTQDNEALELGLDYHGPDNAFAAGISGGWQQADIDNATRQSGAALDGFFLGGFLRYGDHGAGFTAAAAVSYGEMDGSASRNIAFGTIARSANSVIDTSSTAYALDLRYGFGDSLVIGPSAGLEHGESRLKGLQEDGAGALNLSSAGAEFGRTRFGAGGFVSWQQEGSRLLFDLRYARSRSDDTALILALEGSDQAFRILPARGSREGALAAGSAAFDLGGNLSVGADGSAFLAGDESAITASAWLRYGF